MDLFVVFPWGFEDLVEHTVAAQLRHLLCKRRHQRQHCSNTNDSRTSADAPDDETGEVVISSSTSAVKKLHASSTSQKEENQTCPSLEPQPPPQRRGLLSLHVSKRGLHENLLPADPSATPADFLHAEPGSSSGSNGSSSSSCRPLICDVLYDPLYGLVPMRLTDVVCRHLFSFPCSSSNDDWKSRLVEEVVRCQAGIASAVHDELYRLATWETHTSGSPYGRFAHRNRVEIQEGRRVLFRATAIRREARADALPQQQQSTRAASAIEKENNNNSCGANAVVPPAKRGRKEQGTETPCTKENAKVAADTTTAHQQRLSKKHPTAAPKAKVQEFTTQTLAAHLGDALYDHVGQQHQWRVDMVYHNVEFLLVQDEGTAHVGLVLHAPNTPRTGTDVAYLSEGLMKEALRQRISLMVSHEEDGDRGDGSSERSAADLANAKRARKGVVSRPGHFKHDLRVGKGENAMHPAIAAALVQYACLEGPRSRPAEDDEVTPANEEGLVVLDPVAGCGSILMEAAVQLLRTEADEEDVTKATTTNRHAVLLGGDLKVEDAQRMLRNVDRSHLVEAVHSLSGLQHFSRSQSSSCPSLPSAASAASSSTTILSSAAVWREMMEFVDQVEWAPLGDLGGDQASMALRDAWTASFSRFLQLRQQAQDFASAPATGCGDDVTPLSVACRSTLVDWSPLACRWDATSLPLRSDTVDVIIADLPFGRRCGNHSINQSLYRAMLREMHRVLRKKQPTCPPALASSSSISTSSCPSGSTLWWKGRTSSRCVLLTVEYRVMMAALDEFNQSLSHEAQQHPTSSNESPHHEETNPCDVEGNGKQEDKDNFSDPLQKYRFCLVQEPFAIDMGGLCPYVFVLDLRT